MSDVERAEAQLEHIRKNLMTVMEWDLEDYREFYSRDVIFLMEVAQQRQAELDPTPVDTSYAESVANRTVRRIDCIEDMEWTTGDCYEVSDKCSICVGQKGVYLWIGEEIVRNPTIGQVRTACRLFGVTLKEEASDER